MLCYLPTNHHLIQQLEPGRNFKTSRIPRPGGLTLGTTSLDSQTKLVFLVFQLFCAAFPKLLNNYPASLSESQQTVGQWCTHSATQPISPDMKWGIESDNHLLNPFSFRSIYISSPAVFVNFISVYWTLMSTPGNRDKLWQLGEYQKHEEFFSSLFVHFQLWEKWCNTERNV